MSRRLTLKHCRSVLIVTVHGRRVGKVVRDVVHHEVKSAGPAISATVSIKGIADCKCDAEKAVTYALSDDAAADFVEQHMALMHGIGATRGVA